MLQMRRGFIRLQATFRARKVRKQYLHTRRRIMGFQVCELLVLLYITHVANQYYNAISVVAEVLQRMDCSQVLYKEGSSGHQDTVSIQDGAC